MSTLLFSKHDSKENYWTNTLRDFDVKTIIPLGTLKSKEFHLKSEKFTIDRETKKFIEEFLVTYNTTLSSLLYSAWGILLQKYNDTYDVIFGTETSNGTLLPLCLQANADTTGLEYIAQIDGVLNERQVYDGISLQEVASYSQLNYKDGLFGSALIFSENQQTSKETIQSLNIDISLEVNTSLEFTVHYNQSLFYLDTIFRIQEHFTNVLNNLITDPQKTLLNFNILSQGERNQVIYEFNSKKISYDLTKTIDEFFEDQVKKNPENIALVCEDRNLTYNELNSKSNQLARLLRKKGVKPEKLVGLVVERSEDLIIGMLAVIKAGGAYLPVDPAYPLERIHYMFEQANVNILLTHSHLNIDLPFPCEKLYLDNHTLYEGPVDNLDKLHSPKNLMYTLYTSGSTGLPKGVVIEHRNVTGYTHSFKEEFKITEDDVMLQQSTVSFDISVEEIFPILLTGGTLVIARKEEVADPEKLIEVMKKNNVTMISGFPLLLNELNKYPVLDSLHTMISGGDVLRKEYVTNLVNKVKIYNTYGPSETTVCISYHQFTGELTTNSIPTGKPVANYKVYILDKNRQPVPVGVPGEVCIAGVGVSREYLNRPDLTKERYIKSPFNSEEKMFMCGDLARWLPDGSIEFLGRIDNQVKICGRRTEPGEVEEQLLTHPAIEEVCVIARENKIKNKYLTAYVVTNEKVSVSELREHLLVSLPDFMCPAYFVELEKLPLTLNGKIDRKNLVVVMD